jgi:hypothetical protein
MGIAWSGSSSASPLGEFLAQHLQFQPFGFGSLELDLGGAETVGLGGEGGGVAAVEVGIGQRLLQ